ncbi:MAG: hypothetical protein HRU10_10840 [Opitutales bacterium]|nr:hypothetical protein [Opitutales bacterium]
MPNNGASAGGFGEFLLEGLSNVGGESLFLYKELLEGFSFFEEIEASISEPSSSGDQGSKERLTKYERYELFADNLHVAVNEKAGVVGIELRAEDPMKVVAMMDTLVELSKIRYTNIDAELAAKRSSVLEDFLDDAEKEYMRELESFVEFQLENSLGGTALIGGNIDSRFYAIDEKILELKVSIAEESYVGANNEERINRLRRYLNELEDLRDDSVRKSIINMAGTDSNSGIAGYRIAEAELEMAQIKYRSSFAEYENSLRDISDSRQFVVVVDQTWSSSEVEFPKYALSILRFGFINILIATCLFLVVAAVRDHKI